MKGSSAIIVLDNTHEVKRKKRSKRKSSSSRPGNYMDMELNRFLGKLGKLKDFDERQLFLPGICPEEGSP